MKTGVRGVDQDAGTRQYRRARRGPAETGADRTGLRNSRVARFRASARLAALASRVAQSSSCGHSVEVVARRRGHAAMTDQVTFPCRAEFAVQAAGAGVDRGVGTAGVRRAVSRALAVSGPSTRVAAHSSAASVLPYPVGAAADARSPPGLAAGAGIAERAGVRSLLQAASIGWQASR